MRSFDDARFTLAIVWLTALAIAISVTEWYFWRHDSAGVPFLLPLHRSSTFPVLIGIYTASISPILIAVFSRPFRAAAARKQDRTLARLAFGLTLVYNGALIYVISQGHWQHEASMETILGQAKQTALALGFLVVPVNAYYFGKKPA